MESVHTPTCHMPHVCLRLCLLCLFVVVITFKAYTYFMTILICHNIQHPSILPLMTYLIGYSPIHHLILTSPMIGLSSSLYHPPFIWFVLLLLYLYHVPCPAPQTPPAYALPPGRELGKSLGFKKGLDVNIAPSFLV